jgi:hypothetical protein
MKTYGGVDVQIQVFFTSTLVGDEWSASSSGRFTSGEKATDTHWIGDCVGPRTGLDKVEKRKICSYQNSIYYSSAVQPLANR